MLINAGVETALVAGLVRTSSLGSPFHALERAREFEDAALAFALSGGEHNAANTDAGTAHTGIGEP
ncbi:MAG: hypothetical protein JNL45_03540 [Hyphomicrobium sp.]|jgi:hypothetical protein|nr:hypothetical protein [Hyphomicrobium sp.]